MFFQQSFSFWILGLYVDTYAVQHTCINKLLKVYVKGMLDWTVEE